MSLEMNLKLKDYHESEALYNAIENQLEGMAVESLEKDRLLEIRYRLEVLMKERKEYLRGTR